LVDSKRRLIFPLTRDQVFVAPAGDNGIEPHDGPEGAIAVLRWRQVTGRVEVGVSKMPVNLFYKREEDAATESVFLADFAAAGTTGHTLDVDDNYFTIEDIADGQPLEADIKLDDYSYGRFVMPDAKQYFDVRSPRGVHGHQLNELAFHQGERRFQVVPLVRGLESPARGHSR
jgi:hypothetical protein